MKPHISNIERLATTEATTTNGDGISSFDHH